MLVPHIGHRSSGLLVIYLLFIIFIFSLNDDYKSINFDLEHRNGGSFYFILLEHTI